ncbi:MAG TPA: hypothetical protein VJ488_00875 [Dehalococcoidia bacterium]|nr:hypothetical protein [Dehalococcoidia bacterium]
MSSRLQLKMGLEPIALALIFAPEPFSTLVGVGLLVGIKAHNMAKANADPPRRSPDCFEDYYRLKVKMAQGKVAYNVVPIHRAGFLKYDLPQPVNRYESDARQQYRKKSYADLKKEGSLTPPPQVRLYETSAWQQYRKKPYAYLQKEVIPPPSFSGLQKGLLRQDKNDQKGNKKGLNRKKY